MSQAAVAKLAIGLRLHALSPLHWSLLRTHVLLIPFLLALLAVLAHGTGLDRSIADHFFDPVARTFPARQSAALEWFGHRLANVLVVCLFGLLSGAGVLAAWLPRIRPYRRLLLTTAAAMAAGPVVVVALKSVTAAKCPWALVQYGGSEQAPGFWFAAPIDAGQCFPGGHAAGGFALVAFYFAGRIAGNRSLAGAGLCLALAAGSVFSIVRMSQGAHFLSHNLWSAAIDWSLAALIFLHSFPPGTRQMHAWRA